MKPFFLFFVIVILLQFKINAQDVKYAESGKVKMVVQSLKFKILKIDSIQNVYIIYAKRKDSTFKIVSKKDSGIKCSTIRIGKLYDLQITSLFPPNFYQKTSISGIKYEDINIKLEGKGIVWDLFVSNQIRGLCFVHYKP